MNLSLRLQTIYDMTPNAICMDVGADHGKLIISLVENNRVPFGYAIENKKGPYDRLVKEIFSCKAKDKIIPLLSDGITSITKDVKTVIIAGMGGHLIVNILKAHKEKLDNVDTIIIDAHNDIEYVRRNLVELGYGISDEKIVYDMGVYYEIIKFDKTANKNLNDDDYEFGPVLRIIKDETFKVKYENILNRYTNLINDPHVSESRKQELKIEKERLLKVLL